MDIGSTKSEISDISATPTMKSVMTTVSAMTDMVKELNNFVKTSEEDRKAAEVERIRRENKAKQSRIKRDIAEKKDREDERKADKKERYEKKEKEKERQSGKK